MHFLGLFLWAIGAGLLLYLCFSPWLDPLPFMLDPNKEQDLVILLFISYGLILIGTILQVLVL